MAGKQYMIVDLLKAFYWFDDGLQNYLRLKGWPEAPRTQSMIMMNVISGVDRATDIAKNLGITRQAVHITLNQMVKAGLVAFERDEVDGRNKRIVLAKRVEPMRRDARKAIDLLTEELAERVGKSDFEAVTRVFSKDWGAVMSFDTSSPPKPQAPDVISEEMTAKPSKPGKKRPASVGSELRKKSDA